MKIAKSIRCPADSSDCPYYACGWCQMEEETGDHPANECDDYNWYEGKKTMSNMPIEFELNFGYIYDDNNEIIGEKNFVVSAKWLFANIGKICKNVVLETEQDINDFLNWYDPEEDGRAIFEAALVDDALIENAFATWYEKENENE